MLLKWGPQRVLHFPVHKGGALAMLLNQNPQEAPGLSPHGLFLHWLSVLCLYPR